MKKLKEITNDMFPMELVKDLGMVEGRRKAAFVCNLCNTTFTTNVGTAKKSKTGKCKTCLNIQRPKKVLVSLDQTTIPLKILTDLKIMEKGKRVALFECPYCFKPFKARVGNVSTYTTTKCHSCGLIQGPRPGFKKEQKSTFYVLSFTGTSLIKIGITNTTIDKRYQKQEKRTFYVLHEVIFEQGIDAFKFEQHILYKYSHMQYKGKERLLLSGNKEILETNIFTDNYEGAIDDSISSWGECTGQFTRVT